MVLGLTVSLAVSAQRKQSFDEGWRFHRGEAINAEAAADDAPVYTLGGQRVEQMKANRVYITNGKKVIKK
jgi:hypothetical protein